MATRDSSQGMTFIYENPYRLLKHIERTQGPVIRIPVAFDKAVSDESVSQGVDAALIRLQENLDRLEQTQARLRFVLRELGKTGKFTKK